MPRGGMWEHRKRVGDDGEWLRQHHRSAWRRRIVAPSDQDPDEGVTCGLRSLRDPPTEIVSIGKGQLHRVGRAFETVEMLLEGERAPVFRPKRLEDPVATQDRRIRHRQEIGRRPVDEDHGR